VTDPADIAHLLRRTEFVARPARVSALSGLGLAAAVDDILDISRNGTPQVPPSLQVHDPSRGGEQYQQACNWWLGNMVNLPRPVHEKMTLFWHGHFTSAWEGLNRIDHITHQNQLYRELGLGNYHTLTQRMAVEPAMLVYLNNANNVKGTPNQNFARELMELFTLGVGNYTEDDVTAAARAWTGHNADQPDFPYRFVADRHDSGTKTFFGVTRNWDGPGIIDQILRDDPSKRHVAARFITRKLWSFFAYPNPSAALVDELSAVMLANNLEIRPLLRALLLHPEFYSVAAKQGLVRTPIEFAVAVCVHTGATPAEIGIAWMGAEMGQSMFNPPNVSGWRPNAYWLTTSGLGARAQVARAATWKMRNNNAYGSLNSLPVEQAVDQAAAVFGVHPLSTASRDALIAAQRAERAAEPNGWWAPTNLLTTMMLTPEFHMG
jgi:uncharacterized protein (DUF1800 family)